MATSISEFVNTMVDGMPENKTFCARELARAFRAYHLKEVGIPRLPYSDTIQRVLRERRAERGDVHYFDYSRSIWWKSDHVATKEERDAIGK